jgi:hypothetical protein
MRITRRMAFLTGAILVFASACLFSSNPTKPSAPGPEIDPDAAIVTGVVQLFDRTDGHISIAPDWLVRADWYIDVGDAEPPRFVARQLVRSGPDGAYDVRYTHPHAIAVVLTARVCTVDPQELECCLHEPPCDLPECTTVWITPAQIDAKLGTHERHTLRVGCAHAP